MACTLFWLIVGLILAYLITKDTQTRLIIIGCYGFGGLMFDFVYFFWGCSKKKNT